MAFEIDHIFICTEAGAPEAERLRSFGLAEGEPNTHPGQGTACRRFFFANAYLELLFVQSPIEAQSQQSRRLCLWERWSCRKRGACPFGICVRPAAGHQRGKFPFAIWEYRPSYMPPGMTFGIAKNSETISEPFLCYLQSGHRPDAYDADRQQPLRHAAGLHEITRLTMTSPQAEKRSPEFQAPIDAMLLDAGPGEHCLELGFDREEQAKNADFRPELPLIFRW